MTSFQTLLEKNFTNENYLTGWFAHRSRLATWPADPLETWAPRAVKSIAGWLSSLPDDADALKRQEQRLEYLFREFYLPFSSGRPGGIFPEPYPLQEFSIHLETFLSTVYPELATRWQFLCTNDPAKLRLLFQLWTQCRLDHKTKRRSAILARELPPFHAKLASRLTKLLEAEKTLRSVFTQADLGWDLETGDWESLNLEPLLKTAALLEKEKEIQKIADLLGRDYRARTKPPVNPPPSPPAPQEPGKNEIRGIALGHELNDALSSEAALLADKDTEILFFQKVAERRLLSWDYVVPASRQTKNLDRSAQRQAQNERGPMILVLDTSGSMRGKPEEVAKCAALALVRIALEEKRRCYLINFSAQIKTLEVSNLKAHLKDLLHFLAFSFHGGTDLPPALRETLRMMKTQTYQEADVLVLSDFAVPKVPGPLRQEIRYHQETKGSRFYALTISARPLNDILNIFDAAWTYNIHHRQEAGIEPQTIHTLS